MSLFILDLLDTMDEKIQRLYQILNKSVAECNSTCISLSGGFESRNLADGLYALTDMIKDENCLKFLSFVAAITSTGLRGVIKDMIKKKWFDVVITTSGAVDHDIARHFSK